MIDDNTTDKFFDNLIQEKTTLLNELKNVYRSKDDDIVKKERYITSKLTTIEQMIKSLIKYKNIIAKEKYLKDI